MRLDGGFLRVRLALDRNAARETPFRRPAIWTNGPWVLVQHIGIDELEDVVALELVFDLAEEGRGERLHRREDGDLDLGIADDLLNATGECDDRRLVVKARPQVDVTVGLGLDVATAVEQPRMVGVHASAKPGQQEEAVVAAEKGKPGLTAPDLLVAKRLFAWKRCQSEGIGER